MIRSLKFLSSCAAILAFFASVNGAVAQTASRNRITSAIVDADSVTLPGNTHPMARAEYDRGQVADETRLNRLVLVLKPDARQQRELDALTEAQQEPGSAQYHRWLTPAEYGQRFGVSADDVARITGWLKAHGFSVEPVPAGRRTIVFSGTAGQVAETFHTQLHRFSVNGVAHMANVEDPQVPKALAAVVDGVLSLHDFRRVSAIRKMQAVATPENTQGSAHYMFPADFAAIYNLNPLYAAGSNGSGGSIAIVGRSNINLDDVRSFRSSAGLSANQPTVILDGANPGLISGDQDEATLDVEWSGAVASGATVKFVVAGSTNTSDGVDLSAQYIVNHNTAPVMSTSFGNCEANMGSAEMAFYNSLWQQAASEGISSFVSSGDSGAAGCNGGSSSTGSRAGVNGLCSSPYATCVGGTEFNEGSGNYWAATNGAGGGSALGYIPEKVWNESANSGGSGLWASGGGVSTYYQQPSWQQGVSGANSNGMRAVPDVALTAASHDGYIVCLNGSYYIFGGTSASSPSFAGIMAVLEQKLALGGQGNANPTLYGLLNAAANPFHATPTGSNTVPGVTGFIASGAAYNLATGLGSVNAQTLISSWPVSGGGGTTQSFVLTSSSMALTVRPGQSGTFNVAVAGSGGFSGAVALTASAPAGVTVSFSPASVAAGASAVATVSVAGNVAPGTSSITITGTSGSIVRSVTVNLTVPSPQSFTLSSSLPGLTLAQGRAGMFALAVTGTGGFTGSAALTASAPAGVTVSFNPANAKAGTSATAVVSVGAAVATGSSVVTITGTSGSIVSTTTVNLTVTSAPTMSLSVTPSRVTQVRGKTATITATVITGGTFADTVTMGVTGLPDGVTAVWSPASFRPAGAATTTATLTLKATATAMLNTATLTITATGGGLKVQGQSVVQVTAAPSIALSLSPGTINMRSTATQQVTILVTPAGGVAPAANMAGVNFQVTGLPTGIAAQWGAPTLNANGSWQSVLTLTGSKTAISSSTRLNFTTSAVDAASGVTYTASLQTGLVVTRAVLKRF